MEIGVRGMGRVAQTLARSWAATGHRAMGDRIRVLSAI